MFSQLINLLKLRIGVVMMVTALVAMVVTPGPPASLLEMLVLAFAILAAAGSAGAFNQYFEVDLDRRVPRTATRPFVTGYFKKSPLWLGIILLLLVVGVGSAALVLNLPAAFYIFLGAFFYAIVYTVWLKRRSWTNIVIGGASGSFAVLAGAAAIDTSIGPIFDHAGTGAVPVDTVAFLEPGDRQEQGLPTHWNTDVAGYHWQSALRLGSAGQYPDVGRNLDHAVFLRDGMDLPGLRCSRWRVLYLPQYPDGAGSIATSCDEELLCIVATACGVVDRCGCRRSFARLASV